MPDQPFALPLRRLGRTDLSVTALGFGAAAIGNLYQAVPDAVAHQTIEAALKIGVRLAETAPAKLRTQEQVLEINAVTAAEG